MALVKRSFLSLIFTFMHLANAFMQSDLKDIYLKVETTLRIVFQLWKSLARPLANIMDQAFTIGTHGLVFVMNSYEIWCCDLNALLISFAMLGTGRGRGDL